MTDGHSLPPGLMAKIASSVILAGWSRLAMLGIVPISIACFTLAWHYIDYRFTTEESLVAEVAGQVTSLDGKATEAATKASDVATGLAVTNDTVALQDKTAEQFRNDASSKLDKLDNSLNALALSVSGLSQNIADWHRRDQQQPP